MPMRRNLGMCVRRRYWIWAYQGLNVIMHSCLGNSVAEQDLPLPRASNRVRIPDQSSAKRLMLVIRAAPCS